MNEATRHLNDAERSLMAALKLLPRDTLSYDSVDLAIDHVRTAHDEMEPEPECTCRPRAVHPTDLEPPPVVLNHDCPIHGYDPDEARDRARDKWLERRRMP